MAGKIKVMIDRLIELRTKGQAGLVAPTKIKLIMKGVDPDLYTASSPDDQTVIDKVAVIAEEMGFDLG